MKLTFEQKTWIRNYELAKANGVTFDANTQEYIPFDEIVIPEWYEDWLEFLNTPKEQKEKKIHGAPPHDVPKDVPWKEIFIENGKIGGKKRAEILPKERRVAIAKHAAKTRWSKPHLS